MDVAKSTHGLVSISQLPVPLCRRLRLPVVWGEPGSSQGSWSLSSGTSFGTSLQAELPPHGCKHRGQHPFSSTWKNLLSVEGAFRGPGSAAESTSNLLLNYTMEQETNYCFFPPLLEVSFTGFILPLNHFSSETVFQLKSHFWKHLHPNGNSKKIYYTHLFVLHSIFLDGYILSIHEQNETWPERWRIPEDARSDE